MFGTNTILWFAVFMILLLIKHYVIYFAIQGKYMTRRASKKDWLMPLVAHSGAHGIATLIVLVPLGYVIGNVQAVLLAALGLSAIGVMGISSRYDIFTPPSFRCRHPPQPVRCSPSSPAQGP